MEVFIGGISCISHYRTFDEDFFFENSPSAPGAAFLEITPPEYKNYIPAASIRRSSHILKMGISAGMMCLQKTGLEKPDAIIVGTAMGCFEDTDKFLRALVDNGERMLTPTPFIQSTHNTVAGQIALITKCQGYNFTYVHQNISFECALFDAIMLLKEKEAENILVGAVDELNNPLKELFSRAKHIKNASDLEVPLWESKSAGYIAGEGASFFLLTNKKTDESQARIRGVKTVQKTRDSAHLLENVEKFIEESGLEKGEIDLLLSGINGDVSRDKKLRDLEKSLQLPTAYFKNLCGEFFTAGGFALWLAVSIIKKQTVPVPATPANFGDRKIKNILIVNHYNDQQYSFLCVSAC
jgi:3-oxoacyl-[acyl-carrier-protein] synthase II